MQTAYMQPSSPVAAATLTAAVAVPVTTTVTATATVKGTTATIAAHAKHTDTRDLLPPLLPFTPRPPSPPSPPSPIKIRPRLERSPLYNVFPSVTSGLDTLGKPQPNLPHQQQQQQLQQPKQRYGLTPEILRRFLKDLSDDEDDEDDEVAREVETLFKKTNKFWF